MKRKNATNRFRLKADEIELLDKYRAIKKESNEMGLDDKDVKHGWLKTKNASMFFKNPNFQSDEQRYDKLKAEIIADMKDHIPVYPSIERKKSEKANLLVIDIADLHIGKLTTAFETGDTYNSSIAIKRAREGVEGILSKSSGFNIDKILFVAGNDVLHTDNTKRTTTGGTPQDTDGMWYDNFLMAKQLYVDILERLISIADVHVSFNPSNHDFTHGFFLMQVIETHFSKCENIVFDVDLKHRKVFKYHKNFIGTTHGDGAKTENLPMLYATEYPAIWSETKHRYIYSHHVHHKVSKDYIGITFETLRSPSGTDGWHHRSGYTGVPKAIEGYIHSKENGQIARLTHIFS